MLHKLRQLFIGLLTILAMSAGAHGIAKAQSANLVSYRCDLKQDQIVLTYDGPLPGNIRVLRPVTQTCNLSSGTFKVQIRPNGNPDIQGMCGGDPSTALVDISVDGNFLLDTDFNDSECNPGPNEIVDKIEVEGKTKEISMFYRDDAS